MKKQQKDRWHKSFFAVILGFGIGAAVFVFSRDVETEKKANVIKERQDFAEANSGLLAQQNILDSLSTLKDAYDKAILENKSLSEELTLEKKNVENLMQIIKASQNPSVKQIKIYRDQLLDLNTSLEAKVAEVQKLKFQNKNLLTEIESQNVVMYNQKAQNDTLLSKQQKLESTLKDASRLSLSNFKVVGLREKNSGKELETTKAKNTNKFKASFTVNGNAVAKTGKRVYYIQVLDQKNTVLGENKLIEFGNDKALVYSFIVSTDFQGKSVSVYGVLNSDDNHFKKGTYFVNFFDKHEIMGTASLTLE